MKLVLQRRTELALRAIRELHAYGGRLQGAELAERIDTSSNFLTQVMAPLVEASWVRSGRGPNGGYSLADGVEDLSMLDLIQATEGSFPSNQCVLRDGKCSEGEICALHDSWSEVGVAIAQRFRDIKVLL